MANVAPPGLATFVYPASVLVSGVPTIVMLPANAYRLFTYDAGTSTPRLTWSNAAESTPNANPIILDANGQAQIFYRGNYRLELRQPVALGGAVIWSVDNFNIPDPNASSSIQFAAGSAASPSVRFSGATTSGLYSPAANQVAMSISGVQAMLWAAGNVGIGGTPTQKLDVFGTARIQGTTTITTGGLTVTAGGMTVTAGGATITGATTNTGAFTVAGGIFSSRGFVDNATAAAWNIDATGRLLNNGNTQAGFSANRSSGVNPTTGTVLVFDTESNDVGGCYDNATGRFTAPVTGKYLLLVTLTALCGAATNGNTILRLNGSITLCRQDWRNDGTSVNAPIALLFRVALAAADYVEVVVTHDAVTTYIQNSTYSGQLLC